MLGGARGDTLPHNFSNIYGKVIFSTRDRRKIITKELQPRLWAYLAGIAKQHDIGILAVGGTDDHVHLLFQLPPKLALAKAVLLLKANSSKWGLAKLWNSHGRRDTEPSTSAARTSIRSFAFCGTRATHPPN